MMDQLGIKALRPGPSGDEKAPNHANYDESKANPYPNVPDALTLNNGTKVTSAEMWWKERRPEIVEGLEEYVYGRMPKDVPKVTWSVTASEHEMVGFHPVIAKELMGRVDNSSYPAINVRFADDAGDAGGCEGPGSGADDVWAERVSDRRCSRRRRSWSASTRR